MSTIGTRQDGERETWRVFAAAPVNNAVRRQMWSIQEELAPREWPMRWVDPRLAHITLQFYGQIERRATPDLQSALASIAARRCPARLSTAGVDAFPSASRPRVLWLRLAGDTGELEGLAREIAATAGTECVDGKGRSFKAHVTLARLRDRAEAPSDFRAAVSALSLDPVDLTIDRVQLIRSVLGPKGPTHTTIAEWPLGAEPEIHDHG